MIHPSTLVSPLNNVLSDDKMIGITVQLVLLSLDYILAFCMHDTIYLNFPPSIELMYIYINFLVIMIALSDR